MGQEMKGKEEYEVYCNGDMVGAVCAEREVAFGRAMKIAAGWVDKGDVVIYEVKRVYACSVGDDIWQALSQMEG